MDHDIDVNITVDFHSVTPAVSKCGKSVNGNPVSIHWSPFNLILDLLSKDTLDGLCHLC